MSKGRDFIKPKKSDCSILYLYAVILKIKQQPLFGWIKVELGAERRHPPSKTMSTYNNRHRQNDSLEDDLFEPSYFIYEVEAITLISPEEPDGADHPIVASLFLDQSTRRLSHRTILEKGEVMDKNLVLDGYEGWYVEDAILAGIRREAKGVHPNVCNPKRRRISTDDNDEDTFVGDDDDNDTDDDEYSLPEDDIASYSGVLFDFVSEFVHDRTVVVRTVNEGPPRNEPATKIVFSMVSMLVLSLGVIIVALYCSGILLMDEDASFVMDNGDVSPSIGPTIKTLYVGAAIEVIQSFLRTDQSNQLTGDEIDRFEDAIAFWLDSEMVGIVSQRNNVIYTKCNVSTQTVSISNAEPFKMNRKRFLKLSAYKQKELLSRHIQSEMITQTYELQIEYTVTWSSSDGEIFYGVYELVQQYVSNESNKNLLQNILLSYNIDIDEDGVGNAFVQMLSLPSTFPTMAPIIIPSQSPSETLHVFPTVTDSAQPSNVHSDSPSVTQTRLNSIPSLHPINSPSPSEVLSASPTLSNESSASPSISSSSESTSTSNSPTSQETSENASNTPSVTSTIELSQEPSVPISTDFPTTSRPTLSRSFRPSVSISYHPSFMTTRPSTKTSLPPTIEFTPLPTTSPIIANTPGPTPSPVVSASSSPSKVITVLPTKSPIIANTPGPTVLPTKSPIIANTPGPTPAPFKITTTPTPLPVTFPPTKGPFAMPITSQPTKSPATLLPTPESSLFSSSSGSSFYSMKPSKWNGLNDDETVLTGSSSSSKDFYNGTK